MRVCRPSRFRSSLLAAALLAAGAPALAAVPDVTLVRRIGGLSSPVHLTHAGDGSGRLFVVEQRGKIRIVRGGALLAAPFLDIASRVSCCGERGLLSVAFPPGFASSRRFYVNYTDLNGDTTISRFRVPASTPDGADPASEEVLLRITQPYANHNGGQLAFGPDGFLYVGMGDGGSGGDPQNFAQNPASLLGKLLRIDVESGVSPYAVPPSNPFVGRAGYRPEIWALGLRNPWRFSFDRATGDLYIGDVGQASREEVDVQPAGSAGGENYGWRLMEGSACYDPPTCGTAGLVLPVAEYLHVGGDCAVTGGFVYRGRAYARLAGTYFYADYCTGRLRALRRTDTGWEASVPRAVGFPVATFGEDEAGELFLANYGSGEIHQITDSAGPRSAVTVPFVAGLETGGAFASELTVGNGGSTPLALSLLYTPAPSIGATGGGTAAETLEAGRETSVAEAIPYLRAKGLPIPGGDQGGTLRVEASGDPSGEALFASVRTTAPAGAGRAGVAYPALPPEALLHGPALLFGLREDAADRSNLALLNAGTSGTITLRVTLHSGDAGDARQAVLPDVVLGPGEWTQKNAVLAGAGLSNGWARIERVSGFEPWYAYAVFNDRTSNDGSFVDPVPAAGSAPDQLLPVVVETARFASELILANPLDVPLDVTLRYTESIGAAATATVTEMLAPREQKILPSALGYLREKGAPLPPSGGSLGGPLRLSFTAAGKPATGFAGARTATSAPDGGSFGLFFAAARRSTREAWVHGLRQDALSRSNLAFANAGSLAATLRVEIFDGLAGVKAGEEDVTLAPDAWTQRNGVLARWGVAEGWARVTQTAGPPEGFVAYGVVNDGAAPGERTSDGSYLGMVAPLPPPPLPR